MGSSSRRYKQDIEDLQPVEAVRVWDLRPVSYRALKADEAAHKSYGFIAEEVAEIDPRLVFYGQDEDGKPRVEGVNYDQVTMLPRHASICLTHAQNPLPFRTAHNAGGTLAAPGDAKPQGDLRGADQGPRGEGRRPRALIFWGARIWSLDARSMFLYPYD